MTKTCWMGIAIVSLYVVLTGVLGTALFFLRTSSGFPFTLDVSIDKITLKFYLKCKANNQNIVIESLLYPWTIFQSGSVLQYQEHNIATPKLEITVVC